MALSNPLAPNFSAETVEKVRRLYRKCVSAASSVISARFICCEEGCPSIHAFLQQRIGLQNRYCCVTSSIDHDNTNLVPLQSIPIVYKISPSGNYIGMLVENQSPNSNQDRNENQNKKTTYNIEIWKSGGNFPGLAGSWRCPITHSHPWSSRMGGADFATGKEYLFAYVAEGSRDVDECDLEAKYGALSHPQAAIGLPSSIANKHPESTISNLSKLDLSTKAHTDDTSGPSLNDYLYTQNWGEQCGDDWRGRLYVLNMSTNIIVQLQPLKDTHAYGQPFWFPDGSALVCTALETSPYCLGHVYCNNRPSSVYLVDIPSAMTSEDSMMINRNLEMPSFSSDSIHLDSYKCFSKEDMCLSCEWLRISKESDYAAWSPIVISPPEGKYEALQSTNNDEKENISGEDGNDNLIILYISLEKDSPECLPHFGGVRVQCVYVQRNEKSGSKWKIIGRKTLCEPLENPISTVKVCNYGGMSYIDYSEKIKTDVEKYPTTEKEKNNSGLEFNTNSTDNQSEWCARANERDSSCGQYFSHSEDSFQKIDQNFRRKLAIMAKENKMVEIPGYSGIYTSKINPFCIHNVLFVNTIVSFKQTVAAINICTKKYLGSVMLKNVEKFLPTYNNAHSIILHDICQHFEDYKSTSCTNDICLHNSHAYMGESFLYDNNGCAGKYSDINCVKNPHKKYFLLLEVSSLTSPPCLLVGHINSESYPFTIWKNDNPDSTSEIDVFIFRSFEINPYICTKNAFFRGRNLSTFLQGISWEIFDSRHLLVKGSKHPSTTNNYSLSFISSNPEDVHGNSVTEYTMNDVLRKGENDATTNVDSWRGFNRGLVVWLHGGPHSCFLNTFNATILFLCLLGYDVLGVNYRGSTGFGNKELLSLLGKVGTQDVEDVTQTVKFFISRNPQYASKVVVTGGSHGGFLTCHLLGQQPDLFVAGSARNPVLDFLGMLSASDIPDWTFAEVLGRCFTFSMPINNNDIMQLYSASPVKYVDRIKAPLLLGISGYDRRTPSFQTLYFYKLLLSKGKNAQVLYYPKDDHRIDNPAYSESYWINTAVWFLHYTKIPMKCGIL